MGNNWNLLQPETGPEAGTEDFRMPRFGELAVGRKFARVGEPGVLTKTAMDSAQQPDGTVITVDPLAVVVEVT